MCRVLADDVGELVVYGVHSCCVRVRVCLRVRQEEMVPLWLMNNYEIEQRKVAKQYWWRDFDFHPGLLPDRPMPAPELTQLNH